MIPGYNHNIKYKERIFHVQTEDSGVKNPHLITLLYYGGNILESVKSSYAERVAEAATPAFGGTLSTLMQKQHKDVMRGLITGRYDLKIEQRSAGASFLNGPAPLNVAEGSQHQTSFGGGGGARTAAKPGGPASATPASATPANASPANATPANATPASAAPAGVSPLSASPAAHAPAASPTLPTAAKVVWPASTLPEPSPTVESPRQETRAIPSAGPSEGMPGKGAFSTDGGSMLDAMAKAVPTLDADSLRDALEKGDDDYVFGDSDHKGLDAMMLDFLKR